MKGDDSFIRTIFTILIHILLFNELLETDSFPINEGTRSDLKIHILKLWAI